MNNFLQIQAEATKWVQTAFANADTQYPYHNWKHTQRVMSAAAEIIGGTPELTQNEKEEISLAAIFHDVGFTETRENHERVGAKMANDFLTEKGVDKKQIETIEKIIAATEKDFEPQTISEKIIQDADIAHAGKKRYERVYVSLFHEMKEHYIPDLTYEQWRQVCLDFFEGHSYQTDFAKKNYTPIKELNKQKIMALDTNSLPIVPAKKKKKKNSTIPEKGIETMFRVSLRNHTNLSRIADNKANTLISVNAIIISIVLSTLFPKLDNNPNLIYPGISLLVVNIATIILAILSVIPKTTHGIITRDEVEAKKGNLLFFGNFHKMPLTDFEWGIDRIMMDKDYLYKTLTRDLFYLGKVLNRKYMFLRVGYYVFIIGLTISIGMFLFYLKGQAL